MKRQKRKNNPEPYIETFYQSVITFKLKNDDTAAKRSKIRRKAISLSSGCAIDLSIYSILLKSKSEARVAKAAKAIIRYIMRFKGACIYE